MRRIVLFASIGLAILAATSSAFALDTPALNGRVNDYANVMTPDQINQLTTQLKAIETSNPDAPQVVVLTVPSLGGTTVEAVGNQVFHDWKLGQNGKNNGVLELISVGDRKIRIEVGYGLEGTLPDTASKAIISNQMAPNLKKGSENYFQAFTDASTKIATLLAPVPVTEVASQKANADNNSVFGLIAVFIFFIALIYILYLITRKTPAPAPRYTPRSYDWSEKTTTTTKTSYPNSRPRPSPPGRTGFVSGVGAGIIADELARSATTKKKSSDSDSSSSSYSSSSSSYSSSDYGNSSSSSSDSGGFSGGGGDSGGGGTSGGF